MKFRWRIRHKLVAAVVLVVGMTGILSAGSFYGLYSYRRSNKVFDHQHQHLRRLEYLLYAVNELQQPPLTITTDDDIKVDIDKTRAFKIKCIERITTLLASYRSGLESAVGVAFSQANANEQAVELNAMEAICLEYRNVLQKNGRVASLATPTNWFHIGNERELLARLNQSADRLSSAIHREVTQYVEADRGHYRASLAIVYSTSFLVLVMLITFVRLGYQWVFYPIRELYLGVTKLARGDFESRVAVGTKDEMQELAEAFNAMADRLQGIYRDLNRQVEERSRQLIRTERLASVGFLAAGVAHEINNPLASIAFCAEALESRLRDVLADETRTDAEVVRNYLHMVQQEAFRCKAITEKLLNFSRVGEPERIDTDLVALVRDVIEMVEHLGRARGKHVVFNVTEPVIARANPHELKQVLLNLVVNGLESIDEGGRVEIAAARLGTKVEIRVTDNGCGMAPDVLQNLFEPFFTRNRTGKGTGLGLSISHLIVSQHGGLLEARSAGPGRGSTFIVSLPIQTATDGQALTAATDGPPVGERRAA